MSRSGCAHDAAILTKPGDGSSSSSSTAGGVTVYGPGPVLDAGVVDAADASVRDGGGVVVVYGPAPVDAGEDD